MGEQYEVIKYRQSPDTTERNAETIARALGDNDRQRAEFPDFWVWCLDCDHTWEIEGEAWGYAKCCPQCGSWETRS